VSELGLEELKKAIENRPKLGDDYFYRTDKEEELRKRHDHLSRVFNDMVDWANDLERKFVAFQQSHVIVPISQMDGVLVEKLAELEHEQWSHWINYEKHTQFKNLENWFRQAFTPYQKLTEKEKESDRQWARKVLAIIQSSHVCIEKKQLHLFLKWTMFITDSTSRKMFQKAFKELLGIKEDGE